MNDRRYVWVLVEDGGYPEDQMNHVVCVFSEFPSEEQLVAQGVHCDSVEDLRAGLHASVGEGYDSTFWDLSKVEIR